jgi:ABC-2 type transport system permease protein
LSRFLGDVGTIARRELLRYRRERMFLLGQLLLPILAVLLIGFGLNRPVGELGSGIDYASFLASGLLVLTISSGDTLIQDVQQGFLRPILVAPVSRTSIVIGKVAARLLLSAALVAALVAVLGLFTSLRLPRPDLALVAIAGVTLGFVAAGILLATYLRSAESFRLLAVFATLPIYFLSGMFFPVETMPPAMKVLALANPLSYGVDLLRFATTGARAFPLWLDLAVIAALAVVPTALAVRAFERRLAG